MVASPSDVLLTAEQFALLPDDGYPVELVQGRVVRMPPPFTSSQLVATTLVHHVGTFVRAHNLGVVWQEGGVITGRDPDSVRGPDGAFTAWEDLPGGRMPRRGYVGSPRLAIESVSPSDRLSDVRKKGEEYLAAGSRLVWIVDADRRAVYVMRSQRPVTVLTGDDILEGEDVLPGFTLPLPEIWFGLADEE